MEEAEPTNGQNEAVKAVKLLLKALLIFLGVMAILTVSLIAFYKFGYNRQYDALSAEIQSNEGYRIEDTWRHEDITLEDFGFIYVTDGGRKAQIDIADGSNVRIPSDKGKGVYLMFRKGGVRADALISFSDREFWAPITDKEIRTIADFLPHTDAFLRRCDHYPLETTDATWEEKLAYIRIHATLEDD